LITACEKAKITLSLVSPAEIFVPNIVGRTSPRISVTQSKCEDLCADLFDRCLASVDKVVSDAGICREQVQQIILIGGSSHIPNVKELLRSHFGREPFDGVEPREVVVQGAALYAWKLKTNPDVFILNDICQLPIGIAHNDGLMLRMIEKNSRMPTSVQEVVMTTEYDLADEVISVYEGDMQVARENHLICEYCVSGIPPGEAGER
jgi:molecular chaperone DnaK